MGLDRSTWLVALFLLFGVLLPAGCVLWFMNDAAASQAAAARQSVTEAYRSQLPLMRDRVEAYWSARAEALIGAGTGKPSDFAHAVESGVADSLVYFNANGAPQYPAMFPPLHPGVKPPPDLLSARVEVARILAVRDDKELAFHLIQEAFVRGLYTRTPDLQGRLISADEQLFGLHLLSRTDRRFSPALQRLVSELNDYEHVTMPSAQRLFLMDEVRALDPGAQFPALEAERLAAQFLETNSPPKDTWKLAAKSGRVIALYPTSTVLTAMRAFLDRQSPSRSVRFDLLPPGVLASGETVDAGSLLPGWRISFELLDTKPMDEAARARRASYLWAGFLAIGAIAVVGLLAGGIFRRQMRLARLKADLVATVSHELKTPLASMRLLVDSLLDDAQLDPRKTREYLRLIAGENERLTRLIENFLAFSRIERNRQRFDFAEVDPANVIHAALNLIHERSQDQHCQLEIEAPEDLPSLYADEDALVTALLNLIDNAYKYSPANKRVSIRAYRASDEVAFEVEDHGIGIAPRDQKRIFRRFYRVDQRLARETGGCGLGLSIVEYIAKAHGGSVTVRSQPGSGSTFVLRFPCSTRVREVVA